VNGASSGGHGSPGAQDLGVADRALSIVQIVQATLRPENQPTVFYYTHRLGRYSMSGSSSTVLGHLIQREHASLVNDQLRLSDLSFEAAKRNMIAWVLS
jgi:hypothetical protein